MSRLEESRDLLRAALEAVNISHRVETGEMTPAEAEPLLRVVVAENDPYRLALAPSQLTLEAFAGWVEQIVAHDAALAPIVDMNFALQPAAIRIDGPATPGTNPNPNEKD